MASSLPQIRAGIAANYKLLPPGRQILGTVVSGLAATVAPATGPTLDGYITESLDWRRLFFVNAAAAAGCSTCFATWAGAGPDRCQDFGPPGITPSAAQKLHHVLGH